MKILPLLSVPICLAILAGCAKDADPTEKINEPGYYNGTIKKPGGGAGGPAPGSKEEGTTASSK
ncbi:hypothetical protein BH11ARM2_BH11ARM2_24660 [soil metagenome]